MLRLKDEEIALLLEDKTKKEKSITNLNQKLANQAKALEEAEKLQGLAT